MWCFHVWIEHRIGSIGEKSTHFKQIVSVYAREGICFLFDTALSNFVQFMNRNRFFLSVAEPSNIRKRPSQHTYKNFTRRNLFWILLNQRVVGPLVPKGIRRDLDMIIDIQIITIHVKNTLREPKQLYNLLCLKALIRL